MKCLNKTKTAISICNVFLVSKGNLFYFNFIDILCALDGTYEMPSLIFSE